MGWPPPVRFSKLFDTFTMKKYMFLFAVLAASALAQVAPPAVTPLPKVEAPKPVDPRDTEIKYLKEESDKLRQQVSEYSERVNKAILQRNQLAAGLLDLQQQVQDLQLALAKATQPAPAKEDKK